MDLRRLRIGEWAVATAGLLLLVSLFLPWYSITAFPSADANAWQAFGVIDALLLLLALGALAVVPVTAGTSSPSPAIAYQALLCLASIAGSVIVVIRLLNPPENGLSREIGCYLGVLATLGTFVACLVAMRDERASTAGRLTDPTGVPVDSAPAIETLPAPRP